MWRSSRLPRAAARRLEDPARQRRRQISADLAEDRHHFQPAAHLRAARCRSSLAAAYGAWNFTCHARIPNGAVVLPLFSIMIMLVGLISEQISTLRFEGRRS